MKNAFTWTGFRIMQTIIVSAMMVLCLPIDSNAAKYDFIDDILKSLSKKGSSPIDRYASVSRKMSKISKAERDALRLRFPKELGKKSDEVLNGLLLMERTAAESTANSRILKGVNDKVYAMQREMLQPGTLAKLDEGAVVISKMRLPANINLPAKFHNLQPQLIALQNYENAANALVTIAKRGTSKGWELAKKITDWAVKNPQSAGTAVLVAWMLTSPDSFSEVVDDIINDKIGPVIDRLIESSGKFVEKRGEQAAQTAEKSIGALVDSIKQHLSWPLGVAAIFIVCVAFRPARRFFYALLRKPLDLGTEFFEGKQRNNPVSIDQNMAKDGDSAVKANEESGMSPRRIPRGRG